MRIIGLPGAPGLRVRGSPKTMGTAFLRPHRHLISIWQRYAPVVSRHFTERGFGTANDLLPLPVPGTGAMEYAGILAIYGSAQESGKPHDFGGLGVLIKLCRSSRRRCGNVGTRVLCGFPSSEGGKKRAIKNPARSALGASFPQRTLDCPAFLRDSPLWAAVSRKMRTFRKPA